MEACVTRVGEGVCVWRWFLYLAVQDMVQVAFSCWCGWLAPLPLYLVCATEKVYCSTTASGVFVCVCCVVLCNYLFLQYYSTGGISTRLVPSLELLLLSFISLSHYCDTIKILIFIFSNKYFS